MVMYAIFLIGAVVVGLYFLAIGRLVKGLRAFGTYAAQWKSEDAVKANVMKSLALISNGLADFILFLLIAPPVVALIVALLS